VCPSAGSAEGLLRALLEVQLMPLVIEQVNPTADAAIARIVGEDESLSGVAPPPDREWIPQLYQRHSLAETARISGLTVARVREILAETGTPLRRRGRPPKRSREVA